MTIQPVNFDQELEQIAGEAIGWIPLEDRFYLHVGDADATVVVVTGVPDADWAHLWVLLIG
jgi:hypothetical protein